MPDVRVNWPLAGRDAELGLVREVLSSPASAGVLIRGAMGVGKSRLLGEALDLAAAEGRQVHRVTGTVAGGTVPLGAFTKWAGRVRGPATDKVERVIAALLAGSSGPIVLGVDDAHLLDDASALVVHQLLLREQAVVVMSVRTGEAASDAITAPWKDGLLRHVRLEPLLWPDYDELLRAVLGGPVDCSRELWERTAGTILLLRHLLEADLAAGRIVEDGGAWRRVGPPVLPPVVGDLLLVQLGAMSDKVSEVLDLVASAGVLDQCCLTHLADPDAAEEAARRGLITMPATAAEDVRIGQPLLDEAVLARCGSIRVRRLKGRVAEALLSRHGLAALDPVRLGQLWMDSDRVADRQIYAAAAKSAAERLDVGTAERFARATVEAGGGDGARIRHARSLHFLGQGGEAQQLMESVERTTFPGIADAATLRASNLLWMQRDPDGAQRTVELALHHAAGADVQKLHAFRALQTALCGSPQDAMTVIATVDDAQLDRKGRFFVRFAETMAQIYLGRTRAAAEASERSMPMPPLDAVETVLTMSMAQEVVLATAIGGCLDDAAAAAEQFGRRYTALSSMGRSVASGVTGVVALRRGALDEACVHLDDAVRNADGFLVPTGATYRHLLHQAEAFARSGDARAAGEAMSAARKVPPAARLECETTTLLAEAWISAATRRTTSARAFALRAAGVARTKGRLGLEVFALQVAVQLGDTTVADRLDTLCELVDDPRCAVAARYAHALAAGDPVALSEVSEELEVLGDRLAAADALGQAAVEFRAAGMRGSALTASGRAMMIAHECGAVSPAVAGARIELPLTRREREAAILVSRGWSNRMIAEAMSLSVRTVEGHVYRASVKAGVATREELARVVGHYAAPSSRAAQPPCSRAAATTGRRPGRSVRASPQS